MGYRIGERSELDRAWRMPQQKAEANHLEASSAYWSICKAVIHQRIAIGQCCVAQAAAGIREQDSATGTSMRSKSHKRKTHRTPNLPQPKRGSLHPLTPKTRSGPWCRTPVQRVKKMSKTRLELLINLTITKIT